MTIFEQDGRTVFDTDDFREAVLLDQHVEREREAAVREFKQEMIAALLEELGGHPDEGTA